MQNKFAWISTPDELWDDKKEMITTALESGMTMFWIWMTLNKSESWEM